MKDPKWREPSRRQAEYYLCTYGSDADVVPRAPALESTCGATPVVCVDGLNQGVGRCREHAPKAFRSKRP